MPELKVVQVVLSLAPGGTERLVVELVRRTRACCASMVCCLDDEGEWAADLVGDGVPVVALKRAAGFRPSLGWRIAAAARRHRADVLHCHHYTPFVYGTIAATLTGAGLVFTEHGRLSDAPPSLKRRIVNPALGRLRGSIFAVSNRLREHMVAEGLPASRISVIHNGIDPGPDRSPTARAAARNTLGLPADALVVGTAARLDPVKDIGSLLSAFSELRRRVSAAQLVIFGDGPERADLAAQSAALGVAAYVTFAGHRNDVRDLLPSLDVFVNSSISEGISLTILEAMAAGLPIVATAVGGTPEVVVDGDTGVLVPPRDPRRLASALWELSTAAERRHQLGALGRRRVVEYFNIERMVADYMAAYARAARNRS